MEGRVGAASGLGAPAALRGPAPCLGTRRKRSGTAALDAVPVERRLLALAVQLERALLARRVGAVEDPVLPRGQAAEDARFHGFAAAEAQVGFQAGERVGRQRAALFQHHAHFVVPVDAVFVMKKLCYL